MPSPHEETRPSTTPIFLAIVVLFLAGFAGFFYWSVTQRQAAQARAAAIAQQVEAQRLAEAAAQRAATAPRTEDSTAPQVAAPASSGTTPSASSPRKPTVRELPNGDREVTLLDGLVVAQPRSELEKFHLFAEGERNELGHPSGVLPNGSYVHENMPITVDQGGRKVEILTRVLSTKVAGEVVEGPDGPVVPKKN